VYLTTADVRVAQRIARAVRHSSGGLRHVKALGLLVGGQAQVSMNLTDFHRTPVHRVVEMIRREAVRYGASVLRSELVGLIPQAALLDAAQWYLQLDGLQDEEILEHRLASLEQPLEAGEKASTFLDELAAGTATPGGGAAAAYAGAMAAALVAMVARLSMRKQSNAEVVAVMQTALATVEALRAELTASVSADIAAFDAVMHAYRMPKDVADATATRAVAIERALHGATAVPLRVARAATGVLRVAQTVAEQGNINALADVGTAASLALAAVRAAALNVQTNAAAVHDREAARAWLEAITGLEHQAADTAAMVQRLVADHMPSGPELPRESPQASS
jgi:glutamate formiminotransferase / formiminotetrahydrofolate cyclodeaminase